MISTGGHLTILESVDSTNNYAMAMVRRGLAKHGDGYFANAQLQGKGQRGKAWYTEPGSNIILSLAMQPSGLGLGHQFHFNASIALAARDFFDAFTGGDTTVKWPNDIYWRDRKAGGILIENIVVSGSNTTLTPKPAINEANQPASGTSYAAAAWQWAIVGLGININQTSFPGNLRNPVSLKQITGKTYDTIELVKILCEYIEKRWRQLQAGADLLADYNQHLFKKDQPVTLKKGSRVFEAIIKKVTASGELVVTTALEEHFSFGEIEWIV